MRTYFIIISLFVAFSCSTDKDVDTTYENYGDIYKANGNSFIIKEENHKVGWGKGRCFMCHNVNNIHQVDLIEAIKVDVEAIQLDVRENGEKSCAKCHGSMGVKK